MSQDLGERDLFGRRTELDQLASAVARHDEGSPSVIEIVGEPGMGKTTLLAELAELLGDRPVRRARAGCLSATPVAATAVLVDDAHLADQASLATLDHLITDASRLMVVTYRPRQAPVGLLATLAAPEVARRRTRIELSPLTDEDAAALVRALAGDPSAIVEAGEGNPLYLHILSRADVPGHLRATALSDVDTASASARRLTMAAAVLGDSFAPEVAVEIAGLDPGTARSAIDDLHRRDVLRPATRTVLRFRHPLLRQLIYNDTPPGWRRSAHRSAVAALRRRGVSARAQAAHLERCASRGDQDAIKALLEAAEQAAASAPADAARWLHAALALVPDPESPRWLPHRIQQARHLMRSGQLPAARDALPAENRPEVAVLRATIDRLLGNHKEARRQLMGLPRRAELSLELSTVDLMVGSVTRRTVDLARRATTEPGALGVVANAIAATTSQALGDLESAITHGEAAATALDALSDPDLAHRLDACLWTAWAENALSRYSSALAHFDRGVDLARTTCQRHLLSQLLSGRAMTQRWLGHLHAANQDATEAVEVAKEMHSTELRALATCTQAQISLLGDTVEVARAQADAAVRSAGPTGGWWPTQAAFVAALAQAEAGEPVPATQRLLAAGGGPELPNVDPPSRPSWYELLTRTAVANGDRAGAAGWSTRAAAAADDRLPLGAALAALARAESLRPANPAAAQHARRAIELFAAAGTPVEQARATTVLAGCLAATGQTSGARKLAQRAADDYESCGATRLATQARAPFGDVAGRPALSPREREVAALVSHGCTNRQIAERLHVTEKTVETYLSRIFTKLDLTSRATLAAWTVAVS